jgi:hypothetical protein
MTIKRPIDKKLPKRRIFLVDNHEVPRKGFVHLLNQQPDMMVCGEAGNLNDALRLVKENSDKNPQKDTSDFFFLTGHDTYQRIEDEMGGKERIETVRTTTGLNGVQTNPGNDVGVAVATYKNIPIFESNDIAKDTLSRVYLVDKTSLFIKQLLPTQFYSTGIDVDDNPFAVDSLTNEGAFVTIGQLTCTNPAAHAKIRDLK